MSSHFTIVMSKLQITHVITNIQHSSFVTIVKALLFIKNMVTKVTNYPIPKVFFL